MGAPEQEAQLVKSGPGALAMDLPLLHPILPGFVNLPALLQDFSAGAGPLTAVAMEPLNQVHWSQRSGWEHGLEVTKKIL